MAGTMPEPIQVKPASEILVSVIEARDISSESDLGSDPDFQLRLRLGQGEHTRTPVASGSFQPKWLFDTKLVVPQQGEASFLSVELVQVGKYRHAIDCKAVMTVSYPSPISYGLTALSCFFNLILVSAHKLRWQINCVNCMYHCRSAQRGTW